MTSDDIEARYAQWFQKVDKLTGDLKHCRENINTLKLDPVKFTASLDNFSNRAKKMASELDDIIDDEDVEDFLENGPGGVDVN